MTSQPPEFNPPPEDVDPLIGTLIGDRYRIESVLGSGGMGTVYLAEHVLMEKRVALKVLHPSLAVVGSVMDRFQREAIALSRIEHPNVVSASDFGKLKNGSYYLALQYVDGQNLGDLFKSEGPLVWPRALLIAHQTALALAAAHKDNIVHRDLKPQNIMLTVAQGKAEQVRVLDFGLAKLRSKTVEGSTVNIGSIFGTPHYMAPEQISGVDVDARADLYSLGVILYEALEGRRPFDASSPREVLDLQLNQEPAPMSEGVPVAVRELVFELLQKPRELRPATANQVVERIESILNPGPDEHPLILWLKRPALGQQIPRWLLGLPLTVFLFIFVLGRLLAGRQPPAPAAVQLQPATAFALPAAAAKADGPTTPAEPARWPQLFATAEFGDPAALAELMKIQPRERSDEMWRVLALGQAKAKGTAEGLEVFREAISHSPALANDERVALFVRQAASDPKASVLAVTVAAEAMASRGVDILFSVWGDTSKRTPATALAQRYLDEERIRNKASPPLQLALSLRADTDDCEAMRTLVTRALNDGDSRAARPMARLRLKYGCGKGRTQDCYPCLRTDKLLENALRNVTRTPGPKY